MSHFDLHMYFGGVEKSFGDTNILCLLLLHAGITAIALWVPVICFILENDKWLDSKEEQVHWLHTTRTPASF